MTRLSNEAGKAAGGRPLATEDRRHPTSEIPSSATQEVQFNNYQRLGEGWIAPEVVFLVNGDRVMLETYREMRTGMALDSALFDPARWHTTRWME